jgi:DegV family protein with EDD domain
MSKVAVVTDSTACLPKELADQYDIHIAPIEIIFDGKSYWDEVDITPAEVYAALPQLKKLPTTSPPTPGAYLELFEKLAEKSRSILCITVSSKFSNLFDTARTAAGMAMEALPQVAIEVLDSRTAAGAEGLVALAAARAAASGKDLAQVIETAQAVMPKVHMIALIDTLRYLVKSGHIPQAAAWVASLFSIKPIIQILPLSGDASLAERIRTKSKAIDHLLAIVRERAGTNPLHVIIMHADTLEEAKNLRERVTSEFDCIESYIKDFTPVMGIQTGPGVLGIAFYADNEIK